MSKVCGCSDCVNNSEEDEKPSPELMNSTPEWEDETIEIEILVPEEAGKSQFLITLGPRVLDCFAALGIRQMIKDATDPGSKM